jgi:hypothetical protein
MVFHQGPHHTKDEPSRRAPRRATGSLDRTPLTLVEPGDVERAEQPNRHASAGDRRDVAIRTWRVSAGSAGSPILRAVGSSCGSPPDRVFTQAVTCWWPIGLPGCEPWPGPRGHVPLRLLQAVTGTPWRACHRTAPQPNCVNGAPCSAGQDAARTTPRHTARSPAWSLTAPPNEPPATGPAPNSCPPSPQMARAA